MRSSTVVEDDDEDDDDDDVQPAVISAVAMLLAVAVVLESFLLEPEDGVVPAAMTVPDELGVFEDDDKLGMMVRFDFVFIKLLAASFNCKHNIKVPLK